MQSGRVDLLSCSKLLYSNTELLYKYHQTAQITWYSTPYIPIFLYFFSLVLPPLPLLSLKNKFFQLIFIFSIISSFVPKYVPKFYISDIFKWVTMTMRSNTFVKTKPTNTRILLPMELEWRSRNDQVDPEICRRNRKGCFCKRL